MQQAQYELHANVEDRHWWFVARRAIVKRLLNRVLRPQPDALVIDVGCGTGANIAALSDSYRCLGLDHSQNAIDLARSKFPAVEYERQVDIAAYTTQFKTASAVLLMDVLEHVQDDFQLLSQILSLLQPGAHVLITVPADPSLWSEHDENFGHWRRYQKDRLRAVWQSKNVCCRTTTRGCTRWSRRCARWARCGGVARTTPKRTRTTTAPAPTSPCRQAPLMLGCGDSSKAKEMRWTATSIATPPVTVAVSA
jgi:2-polyprenyl-3-methyl-5-hydroxy-6-metoxy-1,4-benzoquinol methylase